MICNIPWCSKLMNNIPLYYVPFAIAIGSLALIAAVTSAQNRTI